MRTPLARPALSLSTRSRLVLLVGLLAPCKEAAGQSPPCPPLDTTAAWARTNRTWSNESGLRWSNDSLRRVLLRLGERDQAPRAEFGAHIADTLYARQLMRLDSTLAAEMVLILDRFGLPTRSMVGPAGSDAAMLIIQHSWPLQERVLASAKAIPSGQISPEKLGMLEDRVLVHQGKPQRFARSSIQGPTASFGSPLRPTPRVSTPGGPRRGCRRCVSTSVCSKKRACAWTARRCRRPSGRERPNKRLKLAARVD